MRFRDRREAGRRLAAELRAYARERPIVLALARGGVPVAAEVARALGAPLDVWVVRKIGVPWQPELGAGAVAEGGHVHLSPEILAHTGLAPEDLAPVVAAARAELARRIRLFRGARPRPELAGRTVLLVDDGIATGGTVRAAIRALRAERPGKLVLATPVAAADTVAALAREVDEIVCLRVPRSLIAIGAFYVDFEQVSDAEVRALLAEAPAPAAVTAR
jgi:putative phosphoribosyl transferase